MTSITRRFTFWFNTGLGIRVRSIARQKTSHLLIKAFRAKESMGGNKKKNRGKSKNRKNSNNNKGGGFGGNKQNNRNHQNQNNNGFGGGNNNGGWGGNNRGFGQQQQSGNGGFGSFGANGNNQNRQKKNKEGNKRKYAAMTQTAPVLTVNFFTPAEPTTITFRILVASVVTIQVLVITTIPTMALITGIITQASATTTTVTALEIIGTLLTNNKTQVLDNNSKVVMVGLEVLGGMATTRTVKKTREGNKRKYAAMTQTAPVLTVNFFTPAEPTTITFRILVASVVTIQVLVTTIPTMALITGIITQLQR